MDLAADETQPKNYLVCLNGVDEVSSVERKCDSSIHFPNVLPTKSKHLLLTLSRAQLNLFEIIEN